MAHSGSNRDKHTGDRETGSLERNLVDQLDRLMAQLSDLEMEKAKGDMEEDEFEEQRADTVEQLRELNESLSKIKSGNLGLLNDISSMQLAIQAAISSAFQTPEIMALFAARQPEQLRERLSMIDRDRKVNKLSVEEHNQKKTEILMTLIKLRAPLTSEEEAFLDSTNSLHAKGFVQTGSDKSGTSASSDKILKLASGSAK